jgi:hypothetical protein
MFVVTEADAAAIRAVYRQRGELSAVIELRRRFPGITDNRHALHVLTRNRTVRSSLCNFYRNEQRQALPHDFRQAFGELQHRTDRTETHYPYFFGSAAAPAASAASHVSIGRSLQAL